MIRSVLSAALLVTVAPLAAQSSDAGGDKQPFSVERSWEIQRLGTPTIAPDGSRIVAPVTRFDSRPSEIPVHSAGHRSVA